MNRPRVPDCDVTVILRVCDDEERIGHVLRRLASHLRSLELTFEMLVADEGSGDNTLAVAALLRPSLLELEVMHAEPGEGYVRACEQARGRAILLYDARSDAPLGALGFALGRLGDGLDVVAVSGRYLVFRRTRAWRAFDALAQRSHADVERRFLKRSRSLGLHCTVTHPRRRTPWGFLRDKLFAPIALARP
ncbi:MAG TPA: glycosyltransferase [Polyangia bacterium]|nr:glycosyltransferase [Polyangia bacterium]